MNRPSVIGGRSRRDRLIREHIHDPYKATRKLPEPTVCPICKAVFRHGRWQWAKFWPVDSHREVCQACNRIRDGYPAGTITLSGDFVRQHRAELINLVRRLEQQETAQHPLHRIMQIEEEGGCLFIRTTDIHLPRRIGEALHHAYKGRLELNYATESCFVRANWTREP